MKIITFSILLFFHLIATGQHLGLTIKDAEEKGITIQHLDSIYLSAVHSDTTKAVFRSETEQENLLKAYTQMLNDLGNFLKENDFSWDRPTRCWNRIYFDSTGSVDYFLYSFMTRNVKPEEQISAEKQSEFNRLLNLFIKDYTFPLQARTKFAQCSPVTYMPVSQKTSE